MFSQSLRKREMLRKKWNVELIRPQKEEEGDVRRYLGVC